jgi:hypothetical protein
MIMTRVAFLLALAASAAALAMTATAAPRRAACTPGPTKVGGKDAMVFCGSAKATVKVNGVKTLTIKNGTCTKTSKYFNVNIGTEVYTDLKQKQGYFAILVGQYPGAPSGSKAAGKDGTYSSGLIAAKGNGKSYTGDTKVKITLKNNRTAGTFSGVGHFTPNLKVSGSFTC